jgi:UDP-N-acetylmuramoylalanine--D-glutamate ligase
MDKPINFNGMKVTVMGLGLFGGGAGVTRFLADQGARVTVTDLRSEDELSRSLAQIEDLPVEQVIGRHRDSDFRDADLVVANPAVPPGSKYLCMAAENHVPVESEINLTLKLLPTDRIVGVTGSNGKTTTSHLLHRMLAASGAKAWLGGNVGGSLLPRLNEMGAEDYVVLELSSFQLERTVLDRQGPRVAVITNLTPNHLDRHKTFDAYVEAKAGIFVQARAAVLNKEDAVSMERFAGLDIPCLTFSSSREVEEGYFLRNGSLMERRSGIDRALMAAADFPLPGRFNLENLMAALAGLRLIRQEEAIPAASLACAAAFEGVPHRLERVASRLGVLYINDSIATTPASCLAALEAIPGEIHLIAGGYDKGLPLEEMAETVVKRVKSVHLVGETQEDLESAIRESARKLGLRTPRIRLEKCIEDAVAEASREASSGATVLLSPGFASYDQFLNFEERGECFRRCVAEID